MRLPRLAIAAALAFLTASCVPAPAPRPASLPGAAQVTARLRGRTPLAAFRGLVSFSVRHPGLKGPEGEGEGEAGGFAGKAVLLWQAPGAVRFEPLNSFGSPLLVVVANRGELRVYSVARGRFYAGRAGPRAMRRWVGIPLGPALLIRILQGALPDLGGRRTGAPPSRPPLRLEWDGEAGALRLEALPATEGGMAQTVWLDPESLEPRRVRLAMEGAELEVRYGPFRPVGAGRLPSWTSIEDLGQGGRLRVELEKNAAAPAGEIPPGLFELPVPPGVRVLPLVPEAG